MSGANTVIDWKARAARQRLQQVFGLLVILVAADWAFRPALTGPFIFDDFPNLENLRHLNEGVSSLSVRQYLASVRGSPGRPLAMLSFMIEDSAWPAYPFDYKRNNLLLHLIAGTLVLWLTLRLMPLADLPEMARRWAPLACAAAWLLNPIQLSATMLVVQRMNILASIFVLAGLLVYLSLVLSQRGPAMLRVAMAGLTLSFFGCLAFLCKENGILIFAYASALNLTLLRARVGDYPTASRRFLLIGAAAPILLLAIGAATQPDAILAPYQAREFTLAERVLTQPRVLFDYLGNILIPRLGGQGILHDDYPISRSLLEPATLAWALAMAAILSLALRFRARVPLAAFGALWFLAGHLIESTVIGLEIYFEHRNYLPMIGPLLVVCALAMRQPRPRLAWCSALMLVWILGFLALTRLNAHTWGDRGLQAMLWLEEHPRSSRAVQWAASHWLDAGDAKRAREILRQGIERIPESADLRLQLVLLDCVTRGASDEQWAESMDTLRHARHSTLPPMIIGRYVRELRDGSRCKGTLDRETLLNLASAILANPAYQKVPDSLSHVHYELAKLYADSRELELLMHELDLAWGLNPFPTIPREQAIHLLTAGLPEDALRYLERSNETPMPWFKRMLVDVPRLNRGLEASARAMIADRSSNHPAQPSPPSKPLARPVPSGGI